MSRKLRIQLAVLLIGIGLMLIKFFAFWLTSSNSILTDALESIINVSAGFFTLYSIYLSDKPKDKNHPYGHGKIEYISAAIEGGLIFAAGLIMIVKAVYNFWNPQNLNSLDLGIYLTAIAGIINYFAGLILENNGKKYDSIAMISGGKHLKTDAYSSLAMIIGLVIIFLTSVFWLDNLIAILFSLLILKSAFDILKNSVSGIMDEADYDLLEAMINIFNKNRKENWIDIHNLRAIKYGTMLHIDCHLTLPWYFTVREAHREIEGLEKLIDEEMSKNVEMFIHSDECSRYQCKICMKTDCQERMEKFLKEVDWSLDNILVNEKHHIKS